MLSVQVWDKMNVGPCDKAIRSAGLGLNPIVDGTTLRLPIPDLTEERRKELAKLAGQYAEKARIAVRNVRRDGMDALKIDEKKHEISEDERKRHETEVQKLTDATIAGVASRVKARCAHAALEMTRMAIQLHGAIGTTNEYDIGRYFKRAMLLGSRLGNATSHRRRHAALAHPAGPVATPASATGRALPAERFPPAFRCSRSGPPRPTNGSRCC